MLDHILKQECKIVTTSTDKHGDQVKTSETDTLCRFRYITQLGGNVSREDLEAFDAIIWLKADEDIEESSILFTDDKYWRVDRLVKARRMSGDTVEFLKAFVKKHDLVE